MTARNAFQIAAIMAAVGTGCASTWQTDSSDGITQSSYSVDRSAIERTVGKLRRLLVVTVERPTPKECGGGGTDEWLINPGGADHLRDVKGYDVIAFGKPWETIAAPARRKLQRIIDAADKVGTSEDAPIRESIAEMLQGQTLDGLMLIEVSTECLAALHTALAVLSFGRDRTPRELFFNYRATLFESASGRGVWQSRLTSKRASFTVHNKQLFRDLEQAVPGLLVR